MPHNTETYTHACERIAGQINDTYASELDSLDVEQIIDNYSARKNFGEAIEVAVLTEALEYGLEVKDPRFGSFPCTPHSVASPREKHITGATLLGVRR